MPHHKHSEYWFGHFFNFKRFAEIEMMSIQFTSNQDPQHKAFQFTHTHNQISRPHHCIPNKNRNFEPPISGFRWIDQNGEGGWGYLYGAGRVGL